MTDDTATVVGGGSVSAAPLRSMRALTLVADRKIELLDVAPPPAPVADEVQIAIKAIGLNHIDVWEMCIRDSLRHCRLLAGLLAACLGNVPRSIKHGIVIAGRAPAQALGDKTKTPLFWARQPPLNLAASFAIRGVHN